MRSNLTRPEPRIVNMYSNSLKKRLGSKLNDTKVLMVHTQSLRFTMRFQRNVFALCIHFCLPPQPVTLQPLPTEEPQCRQTGTNR